MGTVGLMPPSQTDHLLCLWKDAKGKLHSFHRKFSSSGQVQQLPQHPIQWFTQGAGNKNCTFRCHKLTHFYCGIAFGSQRPTLPGISKFSSCWQNHQNRLLKSDRWDRATPSRQRQCFAFREKQGQETWFWTNVGHCTKQITFLTWQSRAVLMRWGS